MKASPSKPSSPWLTPIRFATLLLNLGSGISGWAIGAFVSGALALGVVSNLLFSAAFDPETVSWTAIGRVLGVFVFLVVLAYLLYRFDPSERRMRLVASVDETRRMQPHPGLILLLSPGRTDVPLVAIRHHANGPAARSLKHCWVITSDGANEAFRELQTQVDRAGLTVQLHKVSIDEATVDATYRVVQGVYDALGESIGVRPEDIVADLTGGTKPMTAGMALACLPHRYPLEYVESDRDELGRPVEGSQRVIRVDIAFALQSNPTE